MTKTVLFSLIEDEAQAENEVAERVIAAGWPRLPVVMTDEDFAQMLADAAEENEE